MLRTNTCGELTLNDLGKTVTLCGWVQKSRDLGGTTFIDIRDRYGITQLVFNDETAAEIKELARTLGREFVIKASGKVIERSNKNLKIPTGEIEIAVSELEVLNQSKVPPFLVEDETDGGEELRAKYRYLDLRRNPIRNNMVLRHKMAQEVRKYLDGLDFIEVETPVLIKSTPEGARDFVVPSRMNAGEFYALPQSPQTFKQLLMVSGFDRYFQIVKCFRDEDLRADRQPEFTQIDCEMSFITQEDILNVFEGLVRTLFKNVKGIDLQEVPRMTYAEAMRLYGSDKPDTRFGMQFVELNELVKGKNFPVFDQAELVVGINAKNCAAYTRKQLDELTDFIKRPQIGATGLIYLRYNTDGTLKSSVDKFYSEDDLKKWAEAFEAQPGDLMLLLAGKKDKVRKQLNELRLEMGNRLGLRDKNTFSPLWVVDFPLLEWDDETQRRHAMHHPFTSPKPEDIALLDTDPDEVRANAYDLVINGTEIGGGSIRIHDKNLQALMFKHLGFSAEEAQKQFGFLMDAFEFGAPPHGGIAFGFDRLCSIFAGLDSIRDVIAFPKNNSGRDVMIDSPSTIAEAQMQELKNKNYRLAVSAKQISNMKKSLLLLAFFALVFSACKKSSKTTPTVDPAVQAKIDDDKIQAYIKANNLEVIKDASGLYYQVINAGSGVNPTVKSTIRVAYTGKLLDGTQFDSSANFTSALSGLIKGWQIGIPFIKPGGRVFLIIPSALGYGTTAAGSIPANSVLVFTIDLIATQG